MFNNYNYNPYTDVCTCCSFVENEIDGDTLLYLVKDFDEFCHLIPQNGIRIKVKSVVAKTAAVMVSRIKA